MRMTVAELIEELKKYPPELEVQAAYNGAGDNGVPFTIFRVDSTKEENPPKPFDFLCIYLD